MMERNTTISNEPECCYNCQYYEFDINLCKKHHLAVLPELTKCQEYEPIKNEIHHESSI